MTESEKPDAETYSVNARTLRGDAPILVVLTLDLLFGLVMWPRLPAQVPVQFGLTGAPDRWGPAWENAVLLPLLAWALYALLLYAPLIDPLRRNYPLFSDTVRVFRGVLALFLVGLHVAITLASLGTRVDIGLVVRIGVPLLFVALGNRFGRLRHNWFFGIRVPWTLSSEEVWNRTHRMAGRLWVAGGFLMLPGAFLPPAAGMAVMGSAAAVVAIVPIVYSAVIFRQLAARGLAVLLLLSAAAMAPRVAAQAPAAADIARQVAVELRAENFAALESRFDDTMKAALPDAALRGFWSETLARAGALKGCAEPRTGTLGELALASSDCTFEREKAVLRLAIRPDGRIAGMFVVPEAPARPDWTAPDYVDRAAFTERETAIRHSSVSLPATLAVPNGDGPFPGVVLVHGSGPNDRNETVGGTSVFRDLAQGLASRGVVVLRYEKRTKTYRKELAGTRDMTLKDEVIDDALAALELLRRSPGVDPARVFVLGHSLGGLLAPRIALEDGKMAGIVLLAAPSRPMSEVVRDQVETLSGPRGSEAPSALQREADALVDLYAGKAPANATILGASQAYWLELKAQTPTQTAAGLGVPILVLRGARDYQVRAEDFAGWQRALAGVPRTTLKTYPGLNHLFVSGDGPSLPAEYEKTGHVDREVIDDVAAFVASAARPTPKAGTK